MSHLAEESERLLAQAVRVAHVGEDDLLSCLNALGSRQVDLATDSVLAFLHALGDRVVRENLSSVSRRRRWSSIGAKGKQRRCWRKASTCCLAVDLSCCTGFTPAGIF